MMDLIEVRGDHRQIGFQIGQATAAKIAAVLPSRSISPGVRKRLKVLAPLHEAAFPSLFAELKGMAEGSGQDFEKLLAWNFFESGLLGCTTVLDLGKDGYLAHNEDGSPTFRHRLTLVKASFSDGRRLVSLAYPGMLLGNAFSITSGGLVFAVNTLWPKRLANVGYCSNFLARALMETRSLDEVRTILVQHRPRLDAYHWFVYSRNEGRALSIEVLEDWESTEELTEGVHFHTNHYIHPDSSGEPQEEYPSSRDRLDSLPRFFRGHSTKERANLALSDHKGKWSTCRHGGKDSLTLANVSVDLSTLKMEIAEGPTCQVREYLEASV
jgi:hypothetical protein